jgi:hypothetical protein
MVGLRKTLGKRGESGIAAHLGNWAMIKEIELPDLLKSYHWEEVFGEGDGGNCDGTIQVVPPGAKVDSSGISREMVVEIIAAVNGENDESDWVGLFLLNDGRYLVAEGGCDYTGWDCQANNSLCVAGSLEDAIKYGLNPEQQRRLGII